MRVIREIKEIFENDKRLIDDFTDCDLSNLDLSNIPKEWWDGARFVRTNLSNTNIKFIPKNVHMDECTFDNCDLTYLTAEEIIDFNYDSCSNIFRAKLPVLSYEQLIEITDDFISSDGFEICKYKPEEKINLLETFLYNNDNDGNLIRFYNDMKNYLNDGQIVYAFFTGYIRNIKFEKIDLSYLDENILSVFSFEDCEFDNLKLNVSTHDISKMEHNPFYWSEFNKLDMPFVFDNYRTKRLSSKSPITYQTSLYINLDRICNMKCSFCRNKCFKKINDYNYERILKNYLAIKDHISHTVIGGGEPTILKDDLIRFRKDLIEQQLLEGDFSDFNYTELLRRDRKAVDKYFKKEYLKKRKLQNDNISIITNGSMSLKEYQELNNLYSLWISRHAIDDSENSEIFGDKKRIILSQKELQKLNDKDNTLCCTCFEGGIDNESRIIEYIKFAQDLGYKNIIFQSLHVDDKFDISDIKTIKTGIFDNVIKILSDKGHKVSEKIYSNSSFELRIVKFYNIRISFKEYKNSKEISELFKTSHKKSFDLSMAPNGDIYESWSENGNKVLKYIDE